MAYALGKRALQKQLVLLIVLRKRLVFLIARQKAPMGFRPCVLPPLASSYELPEGEWIN
jgi:hypothetical protein